jgi:hypothetical protein
MFAANTYRIRFAGHADVDTLKRFAELDSGSPIIGRVLIGYLEGVPAAVLSLDDGQVFADPSRHTDHLVANLRVRAAGIRAQGEFGSLRQRLLAGIPASFRARVSAGSESMSRNDHIGHEPVLVGDEPVPVGDSAQHAGVQHAEAPGIQAGACVNAVMGPPNRAPGLGIMGESDRSPRLHLMGEPDRGLRVDVMGRPDRGSSARLMGESDPAFVDALFTGSVGVSRRRDALTRPAEVRWSWPAQTAVQP